MTGKLMQLVLLGAATLVIAINLLLWQTIQAGISLQAQSNRTQQQAMSTLLESNLRQPAAPPPPRMSEDFSVQLVDEQGQPVLGEIELQQSDRHASGSLVKFRASSGQATFPAVPYGDYVLNISITKAWAMHARNVLHRPDAEPIKIICPPQPRQTAIKLQLDPPESLRVDGHQCVVILMPKERKVQCAGELWVLDEQPGAFVFNSAGEFEGRLSDPLERWNGQQGPLITLVPSVSPELATHSPFVAARVFVNTLPPVQFRRGPLPVRQLKPWSGFDLPLVKCDGDVDSMTLTLGPEHPVWTQVAAELAKNPPLRSSGSRGGGVPLGPMN